jgi:tetratricopeptide (TPR) repeat protein
MKIALVVACCFLPGWIYSLLFAQTYPNGAPVAALSNKPAPEVSQPIGFWDSLFHWGRESDEQAKPNSRALDSSSRSSRIRPNRPLILGITPAGSPKRAAALRVAEKGRTLLLAGAYQQALIYFEKALGLDANPYFYYYLARTHYHLAHTEQSLRFLDVAESLLSNQSDWIAEVQILRARFDAVARTDHHSVRPITLPVHGGRGAWGREQGSFENIR